MAVLPSLVRPVPGGPTAALLLMVGDGASIGRRLVPKVVLVGMYGTIACYLLRTQLANRAPLGGWSASGLSLTALFSTCAVMHGAWLAYGVAGTYDLDGHGQVHEGVVEGTEPLVAA